MSFNLSSGREENFSFNKQGDNFLSLIFLPNIKKSFYSATFINFATE